MKKNIIITGTSGSLTQAISTLLKKENNIFHLTRKKYQRNKILNYKNYQKIKSRIDVLIHIAGVNPTLYSGIPEKKILSINNKLNKKVLKIIDKLKIMKIIYFSTFSVYGRIKNNETITENKKINKKNLNAYALSKIYFENNIKKRKNIAIYILRLSSILFENSLNNWLGKLKRDFLMQKKITLFNKTNYFNNCVDIFDLKKIINKIIKRKNKKEFKVYNVSCNKPITMKILGNLLSNKINRITFKKNKMPSFFNDNTLIQKDLKIKIKNTITVLKKFFNQ